jgi:hypothetical protein
MSETRLPGMIEVLALPHKPLHEIHSLFIVSEWLVGVPLARVESREKT